MPDALKAGDKVQWHSQQGMVTGTIKKKLTSPTDIKGHHVGAEAAHKPDALKKVQGGGRPTWCGADL